MEPKGFSVGEAFKFGWQEWKKNWLFLSAVTLLCTLLPAIPAILQYTLSDEKYLSQMLLGLIHYALLFIAQMGFLTIAVKAARLQEYSFNDFFSSVHLLPSFIWGSVLYFLAVLGGMLLLIIPGIIFAIKFCFWSLFVVDRSFKGLDSLKASSQAIYGYKWDMLLFMIGWMILNLIGVLALGIGLLITIPVGMIAFAHLYVKLTTPASTEITQTE